MPSTIGSFVAGFHGAQERDKAAAIAADKAAYGRIKDERSYALDVAGEGRLITGAAEDAWNKMESAINSDKWNPEQSISLMAEAQRFDSTYGKTWAGRSATSHFKERLHIGQPSYAKASKLAGFSSQEQKNAFQQRATDARRDENLRFAYGEGLAYIRDNSKDVNGFMDPQLMAKSFLDWEAEADASGDYNPEDIATVSDRLRKGMAGIMDELIKNDPNSAAYREQIDKVSKEASTWIKSILSPIEDAGIMGAMGGGDVTLSKDSEAIRNQMEQVAQELATLGYALPVIKMSINSAFLKDGKFIKDGIKVRPYDEALSKVTPRERAAAQALYDSGVYPPSQWKPVKNLETGEFGLANYGTDGHASFENDMYMGISGKSSKLPPPPVESETDEEAKTGETAKKASKQKTSQEELDLIKKRAMDARVRASGKTPEGYEFAPAPPRPPKVPLTEAEIKAREQALKEKAKRNARLGHRSIG